MALFRNRRFKYRVLIFVLFFIALYNEVLIHFIQPLHWHGMECDAEDDTCTKILLIADPQIQGELAVGAPLSWILNWDSDRYVRYTFSIVLSYFKPDILIYLGDLTDEGSKATMEEFQHYLKRLMYIFDSDKFVMQVWIPGDNDIGGEGERINYERLTEFTNAFQQPDVIEYKPNEHSNNIVIYKVNKIAHKMPIIPEGHTPTSDSFNILVSHYPLLKTGPFAEEAIKELQADISFVGHDHYAKIVESQRDSLYSKITKIILPGDKVISIKLDGDTFYEIFVPTCSYRMGVPNMGYGAAILEHNNNHLRYQVLWSSKRFPILFFYLFLLTSVIIFLTLYFLRLFYCGLRR